MYECGQLPARPSSALGSHAATAPDYAAAAAWYSRGMQGGSVLAAACLGYLLEHGLGVVGGGEGEGQGGDGPDLAAAAQVYAWAALRGSNDAMNNLARMLAMGRGVAQVRV